VRDGGGTPARGRRDFKPGAARINLGGKFVGTSDGSRYFFSALAGPGGRGGGGRGDRMGLYFFSGEKNGPGGGGGPDREGWGSFRGSHGEGKRGGAFLSEGGDGTGVFGGGGGGGNVMGGRG